jgi:hypothetical protein
MTRAIFLEGRNKKEAVQASAKARKGSNSTTIRIHGKHRRVQEEPSYPKSADPRSSEG